MPTQADAELILRLYDMRRDEVMRKARNFMVVEWWPQSFDDFVKIATAFGTEQNAWLRQVVSYWDMAASFVVRGALDEALFSDSAGELFFLYAKFVAFVPQLREFIQNPLFMANIEKLVNSKPENLARVERLRNGTIATMAKARATGKS